MMGLYVVLFCTLFLLQALKADVCEKTPLNEIKLPTGPSVFGLKEVLAYVNGTSYRAMYYMTTRIVHNHVHQIIWTTDKETFERKLHFDNVNGECKIYEGTCTLQEKNVFRVYSSTGKPIIDEVFFSSCPLSYVISMQCFKLMLPSDTCAANNTVIIVRVPEKTDEKGNVVLPLERHLDNFPVNQAADDIRNVIGVDIGLVDQPFKSIFTFGENSCGNYGAGKSTSTSTSNTKDK